MNTEKKDTRQRPTVPCDGCLSRKKCLAYVPGGYASADCLGHKKEDTQQSEEKPQCDKKQ